MPHPERMSEAILGTDGGMQVIRSLIDSAAEWEAAGRPLAAGRPIPPEKSKVEAGR
jgi:hypothetical protein